MYIVVAYDVDTKRTEMFKKICQVYLIHVQNSVFEGELNEAQLMRLKANLSKKVRESEKVQIWITSKILKKFILGNKEHIDEHIL